MALLLRGDHTTMAPDPSLAAATVAIANPDTSSSFIPVGQVIMHGLVAFFGAITHAIRAHRNGQSKGFVDFILLTIMSSFSGLIFSLLALQMTENLYYSLAAAGAGGFLGVEGLAFVSDLIKNALSQSLKKGDR